jgi:hypothetical protein
MRRKNNQQQNQEQPDVEEQGHLATLQDPQPDVTEVSTRRCTARDKKKRERVWWFYRVQKKTMKRVIGK